MSMQHIPEGQWLTLDSPAQDDHRFDVWGFIRRRKSIVIVLALIGAGLGYFLYQQQVPLYRSYVRIEIIHQASDRLFDGLLGDDVLEDATYVIPSSDVLGPACERLQAARLKTLQGLDRDEAIGFIRDTLGIEQLSQGVIELQYDGTDPADTPVIVNAIAEEYISRQKGTFESESEKLSRLLDTDRRDVERKLREAEQEYADFMKGAALLSSGSSTNQARSRLNALSQQIAELDIEEAQLRSRLEIMDRYLEDDTQREALLLLIGKDIDREKEEQAYQRLDPHVLHQQKLSDALLPWVLEAETLRQKVGPGHPRLIAMEKRIARIREEFARINEMIPEPEPPKEEQEIDYLAMYRRSLEHELSELTTQKAELEKMAAEALRDAHVVQNDEQTERILRRRVESLQDQYDAITSRIEETEVTAGMSGVHAELIEPARYGRLVYPKLIQFLGIGGLLGGLLGLGLGYIVELADSSFRKPEEIIREFGLPILGHIPFMKERRLKAARSDAFGGLDRIVVTAHLPRSRPAEAYRSVRTAICFSVAGDAHRVIQVTSPAAGDGKSTLAVNLAVSLAQSGKKTILVESDFRRPKVHRICGVANDVGIVDVLRGRAELTDVIQELAVDELSVLPCGRMPRDPSELLTRPEYESLLEVLRDKFDYVVVDTPPVLVVTDACSVAPRADAVIVCMRLGRHTRDFGRRAFDQLRDVGANVVGIVINGVEESDAYGYGSYSYSDYSRSYGRAAYTYAYADGHEAYFEEDEETVPVKRLISVPDEAVSGGNGAAERPGAPDV